MKLIFIYGPPASGKLTTARALAKLTGFGVFHNHLTHDLACVLFDEGTDGFKQFCEHLRYEFFTKAIQERTPGLIFTFGYRANSSNSFVKQVVHIVESGGGRVYFVQLKCSPKKSMERVVSETRKCFRKSTTVDELRKEMAQKEFNQSIPWVNSFLIDNSDIEPDKVAKKIVEIFDLPCI